MVQYAQSVDEGYKATGEAMKAETNAYNRAHKTWVAGMLALKQKNGEAIYPDANSTLRLTYGKSVPTNRPTARNTCITPP